MEPGSVGADPARPDEIAAVIREVQERVRARHPAGMLGVGKIALPDLLPILHARDSAEAKVASIGTVNPRAGGVLNSAVQRVKRLAARALDWHVRGQVEFNRAVIACVQATMDALEQNNRTVSQLAGYFHDRLSDIRGDVAQLRVDLEAKIQAEAEAQSRHADALVTEARELKDVRIHWAEWRAAWEEKLNRSEVYMLRTISELNASFQHRATLTETEFRQAMREQHGNYRTALEQAGSEIQQRLWSDLERIRREYEALIHAELRVVRQRGVQRQIEMQSSVPLPDELPRIDWLRFADRFRGSEERIRRAQTLYTDRFKGAAGVLDIGCGRGEFLEAAKASGIEARGIDLNEENVALCRSKGLDAETADLFEFLARQPDESLGGLYCSQVIEHVPPARLPELIRLAAAKLKRGAAASFETPNPECLAIFATHFYLDPTHTRPVPSQLLAFYLEEAGFGRIEVVRLSPASESIPALNDLPAAVRDELFGWLDYALFAVKL